MPIQDIDRPLGSSTKETGVPSSAKDRVRIKAGQKTATVSVQRLALLLLAATAVYSLYYLLVALPQPLLERHAFRQTQTALTAYYFAKDGFRLDYWTPVVGQGWSIPFEFPLFQAIVALIVKATGAPIAATGRVASWIFMAACCWPLYLTLRQLSVNVATRFFCLALVLAAPEYMFWSSTFMIETAALFLTLFFIFFATRILTNVAKPLDYVLGGLFLTLAMLQKSTTALPIAILFSVLAALACLRTGAARRNFGPLLASAIMVAFAVGIGFAWTRYTDLVKEHNPIGEYLTSSSLAGWNFGTLEQRFSRQLWRDVLFNRVFGHSVFGVVGLVILGVGLAVARDPRRRDTIVVALLAGLLPFLIFSNLHIAHDYYQTSATIFFLIAVGLASGAIFERFLTDRPLVCAAAMSGLVAAQLISFEIQEAGEPGRPISLAGERRRSITLENNSTLRIADFVRGHTTEDDTVVWYGLDWSSAPAFYSERKSLTVPAWRNLETDVIANTAKYLDHAPAAIVVCDSPGKELVLAALQEKFPDAQRQTVDNCLVVTPRAK